MNFSGGRNFMVNLLRETYRSKYLRFRRRTFPRLFLNLVSPNEIRRHAKIVDSCLTVHALHSSPFRKRSRRRRWRCRATAVGEPSYFSSRIVAWYERYRQVDKSYRTGRWLVSSDFSRVHSQSHMLTSIFGADRHDNGIQERDTKKSFIKIPT